MIFLQIQNRILPVPRSDGLITPDLPADAVEWLASVRHEPFGPPTRPLFVEVPHATLEWYGCTEKNSRSQLAEFIDELVGSFGCQVFSDFQADRQVEDPDLREFVFEVMRGHFVTINDQMSRIKPRPFEAMNSGCSCLFECMEEGSHAASDINDA